MPTDRPAVSVIVPFAGSPAEARALLEALSGMAVGDDDEVLVADNEPDQPLSRLSVPDEITIISAATCRSSYHARNAGARVAKGEWLLFVDADCRPHPTILDDYFAEPPEGDVGALAGAIAPASGQTALVARFARSRRHVNQELSLSHPYRPFAATANLLVRRQAFEEIGGFCEVSSGGDVDFSWRLQESGWRLKSWPKAVVEHRHRERVPGLWRQIAQYGRGSAWIGRRYPGGWPPSRPALGIARSLAGALRATSRGRGEEARFRVLDAIVALAHLWGTLLGNRPACDGGSEGRSPRAVLIAESVPDPRIDASAQELTAQHFDVRIEADRRSGTGALAQDSASLAYLEDEGPLDRMAAAVWLIRSHPVGSARWFASRGRGSFWRVASRARRLAAGGERRLQAVGPSAERDARELLRLLGTRGEP